MKGILFVVSGPSGVGKSTLCARLQQEFSNIGMSTSVTSRAPRPGEIQGVDYHFVDENRFRELIDKDSFVEWAEVHGNYYGTTVDAVDTELSVGHDVIFDIDYQGAAGIQRVYPHAVTVMLLPPSLQALEQRLRARNTDANEVIEHRMRNARRELEHAQAFDYLVVNENIERAYDELRAIFVASGRRTYAQWPTLREQLTALRLAENDDESL